MNRVDLAATRATLKHSGTGDFSSNAWQILGECVVSTVHRLSILCTCLVVLLTCGGCSDTVPKGYGFIDKDGKFIIKPRLNYALSFSEGLAGVTLDGSKWGFIAKSGNLIVKPHFDKVGNFSEGLAPVQTGWDGPWGFIDNTGKMRIDPKFTAADAFHRGVAQVELDGKILLIDKHGKIVSKRSSDDAEERASVEPFTNTSNLSEDLTPVQVDGKWGFTDKGGKPIIEPRFDYAQCFSEGLAGVRLGDEWGFIDRTGRVIIQPQFVYVEPFREGVACVAKRWLSVGR